SHFTTRCRLAMCRIISARIFGLASQLPGTPNTVLSSTCCSALAQRYCNQSCSISPMLAEARTTQLSSDSEPKWSSEMSAYLVVKSDQHRNGQIAAVFFNGGMTFALCGLSYWL